MMNNRVVAMDIANNVRQQRHQTHFHLAKIKTLSLSLVPANRRDVIRTYYYQHITDRWGARARIVFRQRAVGCSIFLPVLKNGWSLSSSHHAIVHTNTDTMVIMIQEHYFEHNIWQSAANKWQQRNNVYNMECGRAVGHWQLETQQSWFHVFADDFPPNGFFLMVLFLLRLPSRQHSISHNVSMSIEDTYQSTSLLSILKETANDFWCFSPV